MKPDGLRRYGVFALALFLLATARWGSFLPAASPPFIADIVLAVLLLDRVLVLAAGRSQRTPHDATLALAATALLGLSLGWLLLGDWEMVALRDAAPYAYVLVALLVLAPRAEHTRGAETAVTVALVFHAAWSVIGMTLPSVVALVPPLSETVPVFVPRPDVDGFISGLLAGLALHRALSGRAPVLNLTLAGISLAVTIGLGSRGALLGVTAALLAVALLGHRRRGIPGRSRSQGWSPSQFQDRPRGESRSRSRRWAVALLLLALPIAGIAASNGYAIERLSASVGGLFSATADVGGAQGTMSARAHSWAQLAGYLQDDPARNVVGVGFGPNYLIDSKADHELYSGTREDVRSPHNYLLGAWARLGLLGLALLLALTVLGWRLAVVVGGRAPRLSDVDVLAIMIAAGMPGVALVGVMLEAPFGALPYYWALGHLSAVACQHGLVTSIRRFLGLTRTEEPGPDRSRPAVPVTRGDREVVA
ncbi:O-antigen ligase family protein [Haloechinothrix halophila]|uniref:O-antigen ligase family protein n=1 Tax=Haloechinothrix halophila TaxID=1069073 RepID=UPI0004133325|nr:O-antigen ligase family protein [Haloechinothrix halophila]